MLKYIDSEIILERKIGPLVYVYIMIIIVIMLSLIIFFILCYYKTYYTIRGVVTYEEDFYIRIYVPIEDIKYITGNDIVRINKNDYKYSVFSIDSEYFTDNNNTYQIVKIKVDLDSKYRFNNLTIDLSFLKDNKRIIDYILE